LPLDADARSYGVREVHGQRRPATEPDDIDDVVAGGELRGQVLARVLDTVTATDSEGAAEQLAEACFVPTPCRKTVPV
jgi:hypothetical protein